jgi:sulfur carrier protein
MNIHVNGKALQLPEHSSIMNLLELLEMTQGRVAVELNAGIVPRSQHHNTQLKDGDLVEIVHAIGGG